MLGEIQGPTEGLSQLFIGIPPVVGGSAKEAQIVVYYVTSVRAAETPNHLLFLIYLGIISLSRTGSPHE